MIEGTKAENVVGFVDEDGVPVDENGVDAVRGISWPRTLEMVGASGLQLTAALSLDDEFPRPTITFTGRARFDVDEVRGWMAENPGWAWAPASRN